MDTTNGRTSGPEMVLTKVDSRGVGQRRVAAGDFRNAACWDGGRAKALECSETRLVAPYFLLAIRGADEQRRNVSTTDGVG